MKRLVGILLVAGCGSEEAAPKQTCEGVSDTGDVRVFVVGHKQTLADAVSYESYERSFRRHIEAVEHCISRERPNLVVFPENAALGALLIGSRGELARSQATSVDAFTAILAEYGKPFAWYTEQFPNASLRRRVLLSVTDVAWRAFEGTFGGIARDHGVWVMSSADVAPAERSSDPALIAELGDPDLPNQSEVWVATSAEAYNSAYLFDPTGSIAGRVDKVFLTDPEEKDLELDNGSFSALTVLDTPFATIGVATSRDAFYPPFMQRLEDLGANLIVQPEAFSGWALGELPGEWYPDVFTSSAWTHQQKYRTFDHNLTPQYTGNFFELVFDGQVTVTERAAPGRGLGAYIGQDPIPGYVHVGPWVEAEPSGSIDERRAHLKSVGLELMPGSGSPRENAYIDSMVVLDLDLSDPEGQQNPDVVATQAGALVVWQENDQIRFHTTTDGITFTGAQDLAPGIRPSACTSEDGRVAIVWQDDRIYAAIAPSLGSTFGAPIEVGTGWEPDCGFLPTGELSVVWSDLSSGVARLKARLPPAPELEVDTTSLGLPRLQGTQIQPALSNDGRAVVWLDYRERSWDVYAAIWNGTAFGPSTRIDGAPPEAHERLCGEPRVEALGDTIVAAWTDLRERRAHPDIAFATSTDAGATWSARTLVPGGPGSEPSRSRGGSAMPRYRPAIALSPAGFELFFQDLSPEKSAIFRSDGGAPERVDDTADAPVSLTRPRAAKLGAETLVVWEDGPGSVIRATLR